MRRFWSPTTTTYPAVLPGILTFGRSTVPIEDHAFPPVPSSQPIRDKSFQSSALLSTNWRPWPTVDSALFWSNQNQCFSYSARFLCLWGTMFSIKCLTFNRTKNVFSSSASCTNQESCFRQVLDSSNQEPRFLTRPKVLFCRHSRGNVIIIVNSFNFSTLNKLLLLLFCNPQIYVIVCLIKDWEFYTFDPWNVWTQRARCQYTFREKFFVMDI